MAGTLYLIPGTARPDTATGFTAAERIVDSSSADPLRRRAAKTARAFLKAANHRRAFAGTAT
jgi:hypothetical protein